MGRTKRIPEVHTHEWMGVEASRTFSGPMRVGASDEYFRRKGQETLPGQAREPSAIVAAAWVIAPLAEIGDGNGLVRLALGAFRQHHRNGNARLKKTA